MGVIQLIAGFLRMHLLMQYVSRSVITGFVNALAILIFIAQLPELTGVPMLTSVLVAAGLAVIYLLPRLTTAITSHLAAIVNLTAGVTHMAMAVRPAGDIGDPPAWLPALPHTPMPFTPRTMRLD